MKELPTDDPLYGQASVRADGRTIHPLYLFEAKTPAESKYPWDYLAVVAKITAAQAFRAPGAGGCTLARP